MAAIACPSFRDANPRQNWRNANFAHGVRIRNLEGFAPKLGLFGAD